MSRCKKRDIFLMYLLIVKRKQPKNLLKIIPEKIKFFIMFYLT